MDKSRFLFYFLTYMIPERCCALHHGQHDERLFSSIQIATFLINQEESSGLGLGYEYRYVISNQSILHWYIVNKANSWVLCVVHSTFLFPLYSCTAYLDKTFKQCFYHYKNHKPGIKCEVIHADDTGILNSF